MLVVESGSQVEGIAVDVARRKRPVVILVQVQLRALVFLAQHTGLDANAQRAAQQAQLEGILCRQALVGEDTDVVAHQHQTHAMPGVHQP